MSTLKVNEVRHLSNTGSANIVLESNSNINLQTTGTKALSVDGTLTVTGLSTLNGDAVFGNASTDTVSLISTISGFNNFSGFTGEIRMYAGNAAGTAPPAGWLYCNGDTIGEDSGGSPDHESVTYQALFTMLSAVADDWGNTGSEIWGTNSVKLPDFRSRSPVGVGTGAENAIGTGTDSVALTVRALSDTSGAQNHVLVTAEIPAHLHGATSAATASNYDTVATVFASALTGTIPAHSHTVVDHVHTIGTHTHTSAGHSHDLNSHTHNIATTEPSTTGVPTATVFSEYMYGRTGVAAGKIAVGGDYQGGGYGKAPMDSHTHYFNVPAHATQGPSVSSTVATTPAPTGNNTSANTGSSGAQTSSEQAIASVTFNDSTPTLTSTVTPGGHTHTIATTNTGGGGAHNNISPLIAVNFIIKV